MLKLIKGGLRVKQILLIIADSVLLSFALYLAYAMRLGSVSLSVPEYREQFFLSIPIVVTLYVAIFYFFKLYRGMWRFFGIHDLIILLKAVTLGSVLSIVVLVPLGILNPYPRSIYVINWFDMILLIGGARLAYRMFRESQKAPGSKQVPDKNIFIVGAGKTGDMIIREILRNDLLHYRIVGFIDDDRAKRNASLHGYRVLGCTRDIPKLAAALNVSKVFLAIPSATAKAKRRIVRICNKAGLTIKTVPNVGDILRGSIKVSSLRDFQIEDLLGREPVKLDEQSIKNYVRNKTVMITGAGGSIGSELCRQIALIAPAHLVLFERGEFNLYQVHMELLDLFPGMEISPVIGDVLNRATVEQAMKKYKPHVVFHAAAYKHVPLMEINPVEALRNNVLGTWTVANLAHTYGVEKFVMISTDKAVRPTNVMGASKRMAELICHGLFRNSNTQFVTVRFGNVLNSVGSVIPLFKKQIEKGGPLTVTHPDIYRYFMTIPEAVQLIMQAGAMGQGGEIFILDMGQPVRIVDLARDMITLSGLEPEKDIQIVFTGLRPGEKLYEELLTGGEALISTPHEKIKVASVETVDASILLTRLDNLVFELMRNGYSKAIVNTIKEIVPDFQPENGGPNSQHEILRAASYEMSHVDVDNAAELAG